MQFCHNHGHKKGRQHCKLENPGKADINGIQLQLFDELHFQVFTKQGRDKSALIAALRQAKIYPPGKLRQPQSTSWTTTAARRGLRQQILKVAAAKHMILIIDPQKRKEWKLKKSKNLKGGIPIKSKNSENWEFENIDAIASMHELSQSKSQLNYNLLDCGSLIAAAAIHEVECTSARGLGQLQSTMMRRN